MVRVGVTKLCVLSYGSRPARIGVNEERVGAMRQVRAFVVGCVRGFGGVVGVRGRGHGHVLGVAAAVVVTAGLAAAPVSAAIPSYTLVGQFAAPGHTFDVLPDGRLVSIDSGGTVFVQDALNTGAYSALGAVDFSISMFGASFLRVSPDGSRLAIGDGNFGGGSSVGVVSMADLSFGGPSAGVSAVVVGNNDAVWADNSTLYVNGSDNSSFSPDVFRVDVETLSATRVIGPTGGGSGGITLRDGVLYTADGFNTDMGGVFTGNIRAFGLGDLPASGSGDPAVAFLSGVLVADALSGSSLGFDPFGNLLVGGGDFFSGSGDFGYAAVIDGAAIAAALAGGGVAPDSSELRLSPAGPDVFYGIRFNAATEELLVIGGGTVYRYAVPAPGGAAAFAVVGVFAARRRRA